MENKLVYHYCSIETFLSIIQNSVLRLTDIEKSNDYSERVYMETLILKQFQKKINNNPNGYLLDNFIVKYYQSLYTSSNLYASCFSEDGDLLSQWRAYADNGTGVSIGFSKEYLEKTNNDEWGLKFKKINYNLIQHEEYAKKQVEIILTSLEDGKNFYAAMGDVFQNRIAENSFMKNSAFAEEKEWRLSIAMSPEARITHEATMQDFHLSPIKIYSKNNKLITYFDLSFDKIKNLFIKKIVLGPNCKVEFLDIIHCLYVLGYDANNIAITKSDATYKM